MIYLLCILLPPVAVLLKGKPVQACLNFLLWLCLWIPGSIHAFMIVKKAEDDKRHKKELKKLEAINKTLKENNINE